MDNHAHLLVDANGADISKVMHGINFSYAMYFNKKNKKVQVFLKKLVPF
ncbi:transposase [bacterium AH-315-N14]|nr:transposase [bacterium AH-315-N14]